MRRVALVLGIQLILVAGLVLCTPAWCSFSIVKQIAFVAGSIALMAVIGWQKSRAGQLDIRIWPTDLPVCIFLLWVFASFLWSAHPWAGVGPTVILIFIVLAFRAAQSIEDVQLLRRQFLLFAVTAALLAGVGIAQYAAFKWGGGFMGYLLSNNERVTSTTGNPVVLSSFLDMGVFMLLGYYLSARERRKTILVALLFVVIAVGVGLARSRASLLGLTAGFITFAVVRWWLMGRSAMRVPRALGILAVGVLLATLVFIATWRIASDGLHVFLVDPVRLVIWANGLEAAGDSLLLGHGIGQFQIVFENYERTMISSGLVVGHAHCEALEILVELGAVGLAICVWFMHRFVRELRSMGRTEGNKSGERVCLVVGASAAMVAVLVESLVNPATRSIQIAFPAALTAGLCLGVLGPYRKPWRTAHFQVSRSMVARLRTMVLSASVVAVVALTIIGHRLVLAEVHASEGRVLVAALRQKPELRPYLINRVVVHFRRSVELNPYMVDAWYSLGVYTYDQKAYGSALDAFERVTALDPNYGEVKQLKEHILKLGRNPREANTIAPRAGMDSRSNGTAGLTRLSSTPARPRRSMTCGPDCLWLVARSCGKNVTLARVAELAGTELSLGTSVANMVRAAEQIGLRAEVVRGDLDAIVKDGRRAILIINDNTHYVLLEDCDPGVVRVVDGDGRREIIRDTFNRSWNGLAIMVGDFPPESYTVRAKVLTIAMVLSVAVSLIGLWTVFSRRNRTLRGGCQGRP